MVSIKDVVRSSVKVPEFDKNPEEGRRTYRPKRCGNNNKDEDNSPKNLNDKNLKTLQFSFSSDNSISFFLCSPESFSLHSTAFFRCIVYLCIDICLTQGHGVEREGETERQRYWFSDILFFFL